MATINMAKIGTVASLAGGATTTFTWNNYPQNTALSYCAIPDPPAASGPHGTRTGSVEITRVVVTYQRDNDDGDKRHVKIDIKNVGTSATGVDVYQTWIT